MIAEEESANFETFRDCLSTTTIQKLAPDGGGKAKKKVKGRKNEIKPVMRNDEEGEGNDAAELGDFVEVRCCSLIVCTIHALNDNVVPRRGDLPQSPT